MQYRSLSVSSGKECDERMALNSRQYSSHPRGLVQWFGDGPRCLVRDAASLMRRADRLQSHGTWKR